MKKTLLAIGAIALLLSGCASTSPEAPSHEDAKAKQFATIKGKSNIYLYRNESYGMAISMPLFLDGKSIGSTGAKTYVKATTNPGKHILTSKAENDNALQLTTKAGKNYFVWQEVKMGIISARSKLKLVSDSEGKKDVRECSLIKTK